MAKLKFTAANEAIAESVTGAYDKVESAVVGAYKQLEGSVVGGYTKLEDAFVERLPDKRWEIVEGENSRLKKETPE